jgi:hypothetical protein
MTLVQTEPKAIKIWSTAVSAVYVWDTKVRPSIQPITTAGIYHSSDLWLISISSDWSTWTTIADKNLWATVVYHDGDALSESNCWYYYQWWNNHPYPFTWTVTTSSTRVNPTGYWPWTVNWYWSYTPFIKGTKWWMTTYVADLWWNVTGTNAAKQWPCDAGYHVPSDTERDGLNALGISISAWTSGNWSGFKDYLLMPYCNKRRYNWEAYSPWTTGIYWSCSWANAIYAGGYWFNDTLNWYNQDYNNEWRCIRPFYNTSVQPDSTWTILYQ